MIVTYIVHDDEVEGNRDGEGKVMEVICDIKLLQIHILYWMEVLGNVVFTVGETPSF